MDGINSYSCHCAAGRVPQLFYSAVFIRSVLYLRPSYPQATTEPTVNLKRTLATVRRVRTLAPVRHCPPSLIRATRTTAVTVLMATKVCIKNSLSSIYARNIWLKTCFT